MSWSILFIGTPEKVAAALEENSSKLEGASKQEYDTALPHLTGLVKQNFGQESLLKICASGHGYFVDGVQQNGTCAVSIENIYGVLV